MGCAGPGIGHTGTVWGVAFSPSGDRMVTCSADLSLHVWTTPVASGVLVQRHCRWAHDRTMSAACKLTPHSSLVSASAPLPLLHSCVLDAWQLVAQAATSLQCCSCHLPSASMEASVAFMPSRWASSPHSCLAGYADVVQQLWVISDMHLGPGQTKLSTYKDGHGSRRFATMETAERGDRPPRACHLLCGLVAVRAPCHRYSAACTA